MVSWAGAGVSGKPPSKTGPRGGLSTAAGVPESYWFRGDSFGVRMRNGLLGIFAVLLLGFVAMNTEMMRNRLEQSANEGKMAGRELIYPAAIGMFLERPLLGWGAADNMFEVAHPIGDTKHAS